MAFSLTQLDKETKSVNKYIVINVKYSGGKKKYA